METEKITLDRLIDTAIILAKENAPYQCPFSDDEGNIYIERMTGHWTGTKDEMETFLGRRLTDIEIDCLSLSRGFGPNRWPWIMEMLWPDGNQVGAWLDWGELSDELYRIKNETFDRPQYYHVVDDGPVNKEIEVMKKALAMQGCKRTTE